MPEKTLEAHSRAEAYFYLNASLCVECGKGGYTGGDLKVVKLDGKRLTIQIEGTCRSCSHQRTGAFTIPIERSAETQYDPPPINNTDAPSKILDVGQWVVMFRMLTEISDQESDKFVARRLGLEAAQCLDEALKFFDDPNSDLPPSEAFFYKASQDRFQAAPQQFSRRRLVELRSKLPSKTIWRPGDRRSRRVPWWAFWRRN